MLDSLIIPFLSSGTGPPDPAFYCVMGHWLKGGLPVFSQNRRQSVHSEKDY
jgi:hypothetical protein